MMCQKGIQDEEIFNRKSNPVGTLMRSFHDFHNNLLMYDKKC